MTLSVPNDLRFSRFFRSISLPRTLFTWARVEKSWRRTVWFKFENSNPKHLQVTFSIPQTSLEQIGCPMTTYHLPWFPLGHQCHRTYVYRVYLTQSSMLNAQFDPVDFPPLVANTVVTTEVEFVENDDDVCRTFSLVGEPLVWTGASEVEMALLYRTQSGLTNTKSRPFLAKAVSPVFTEH